MTVTDHDARGAYASPPIEPLQAPAPAARPSAAEEARTLVAGATRGTLGTLATHPPGHPFVSVTPYGVLGDGSPVLFISGMAEHTRNLDADSRASLLVAESEVPGDPLAVGRVTLLGRVEPIDGEVELAEARAAYLAANPDAAGYIDFGDFSFRRLDVDRLRWVGGFGRMAWCEATAYAGAEPDPVRPIASDAIGHLNADHSDALVAAARAFGGHPDATDARAERIDRYGIDLALETPRGTAATRVGFTTPVTDAGSLRAACIDLAKRSRESARAPQEVFDG